MGAFFHGREIVQAVDQRRQAKGIRKQDGKFLPLRRTHFAHRGHECDALDPFRRRQVHLPGEGMQVPHRGCHHLPHPRVRCGRHLVKHRVCNRVRRQPLHSSLPFDLTAVTVPQPTAPGHNRQMNKSL